MRDFDSPCVLLLRRLPACDAMFSNSVWRIRAPPCRTREDEGQARRRVSSVPGECGCGRDENPGRGTTARWPGGWAHAGARRRRGGAPLAPVAADGGRVSGGGWLQWRRMALLCCSALADSRSARSRRGATSVWAAPLRERMGCQPIPARCSPFGG
jgi:hypothetical protein